VKQEKFNFTKVLGRKNYKTNVDVFSAAHENFRLSVYKSFSLKLKVLT